MNRQRLHAADCSVHEPSARCSCGLHNVLTLLNGVANDNAHLFVNFTIIGEEPTDG